MFNQPEVVYEFPKIRNYILQAQNGLVLKQYCGVEKLSRSVEF